MDIKNEIENRYSKLSEKEKNELKVKDKKSYKLSNIISTSIIGFLALISLIISFIVSEKDKIVFIICFAIFAAIALIVCLCLTIANKKTDEQRVKRQIKYNIEYEMAQNSSKTSLYNEDIIKKVTIIDTYTQMSDKLHAILNYQEIIQTRYYKFKIDYQDGTSKIITTEEGSDIYNKLISFVTKEENSQNNIEELKKYKQLLDDNLITEEEYNKKKKQLLDI